jgi:hypothetical protein
MYIILKRPTAAGELRTGISRFAAGRRKLLAKATRARKNIGLPMTRANMRQHGVGPLLHRATGGAMEAPPCITFSRWRTLAPALFQDTRHGPATKVWDETEFLNLPEGYRVHAALSRA